MDDENPTFLIAAGNAELRTMLSDILSGNGFTVLSSVSDGIDGASECRRLCPDVLLTEVDLPFVDGFALAGWALEHHYISSVMFTAAQYDPAAVQRAVALGAAGYFVEPLSERLVVPWIKTALVRERDLHALDANCAAISDKLEEHRIIERACGVFAQKSGCSAREAELQLKALALKKGLELIELARLISLE